MSNIEPQKSAAHLEIHPSQFDILRFQNIYSACNLFLLLSHPILPFEGPATVKPRALSENISGEFRSLSLYCFLGYIGN